MRYRLSKILPMRFRSIYNVEISQKEIEEGGHGNHFVGTAHRCTEKASWWQFRGRVWGTKTVRYC